MKGFNKSLLHKSTRYGSLLISALVLSACQHLDESRNCIDCTVESSNSETSTSSTTKNGFICDSAERFAGKVVGDGHCVSLIKRCTDLPITKEWRPGRKITQGQIPKGAIIATFAKGRYPNKRGYHAAIYISHNERGIWVWDQWQGKAVHKRMIRFGNKNSLPANSAEAYRLVELKP